MNSVDAAYQFIQRGNSLQNVMQEVPVHIDKFRETQLYQNNNHYTKQYINRSIDLSVHSFANMLPSLLDQNHVNVRRHHLVNDRILRHVRDSVNRLPSAK